MVCACVSRVIVLTYLYLELQFDFFEICHGYNVIRSLSYNFNLKSTTTTTTKDDFHGTFRRTKFYSTTFGVDDSLNSRGTNHNY